MSNNYNHKEIEMLKQTFGEDWRAGMRKNPHIDRVSEREVEQAKAKRQKEVESRKREAMKEAVETVHKQGKIDGKKANRLINILNDQR
jgi:hypothetical protein